MAVSGRPRTVDQLRQRRHSRLGSRQPSTAKLAESFLGIVILSSSNRTTCKGTALPRFQLVFNCRFAMIPIQTATSAALSGKIDLQGHANQRRIAKQTNLLVFNSVVLDLPGSPAQLYRLHAPPTGIGEIATGSRAGRQLLSISRRPSMARAKQLLRLSNNATPGQ